MSLVEAVSKAISTLENLQGDINPERGYAEELERDVIDTIEELKSELQALQSTIPTPTGQKGEQS